MTFLVWRWVRGGGWAYLAILAVAIGLLVWGWRAIDGVWERGLAAGEMRERAAWEQKERDLKARLQAEENAKQAAIDAIAANARDRQRAALEQAQTISALQLSLQRERQTNAGKACIEGGAGAGSGRVSGGVWNDIRAADHD